MKSPYDIIKSRIVTEKAEMLGALSSSSSNKSIARFDKQKVVFLVDLNSTKIDIKNAIESIYPKSKVVSVNTILTKGKPKRDRKGNKGRTAAKKKAVVTFTPNSKLEDI